MGTSTTQTHRKFNQNLPRIAWVIVYLTVFIAVIAWGSSLSWAFGGMSLYKLFPLFGLLAFSLFWVQYVISALALYTKADFGRLTQFMGATSFLTLVLLLLHPGVLSYQLWQDGYGLPPLSILQHAVLPGYEWIVLLGMTAWVVFMFYLVTYKVHAFLQTKKWWVWFGYIGELAMFAVFYHGLRLGDQLQDGWFRWVWFGFGIVLLISVLYLNKDMLRRVVKG